MDHGTCVDDIDSSASRPGIFFIGSNDVGKRTLLSRLLSKDIENDSDSPSRILTSGWKIDTKYYTADVSIWMSHLYEEFSITENPMFCRVAALVMVFDMSNLSSFSDLKKWVSCNNIQNYDILLCIGNKVDLVPGHPAHVEYRRRLLNLGQPSVFESSEYGISESEGISLLGDEEEPLMETKRSCMEWCLENNIEYIEACASNAQFDRCLSVDGDSQGVERLLGALTAHMWPGMILKSGDVINQPSLPELEDTSDEEEPNYEFEYEILSPGSIEPWDDTDISWVSANKTEPDFKNENLLSKETHASTSRSEEEINNEKIIPKPDEPNEANDENGVHFELEDMEQLMSEIGSVRDSLRLMPDFQRREMAAKLAMKMASMFGDSSGDEGEIEP